jgi:NAD(P) transhydrogenase subunit alpha
LQALVGRPVYTSVLHPRLLAEQLAMADVAVGAMGARNGRTPMVVTEDMVRSMKPGSVVLDMAVEQGGNCAVSEPGQTVVRHGVTIIGQPNLPATVPADASALYSRNVLDFLKLVLTKEGGLTVNREDDIVAACLLCSGGEIIRRNG